MHTKYKEVVTHFNDNDNNRKSGYNKNLNKKIKRFLLLFIFIFVFILANFLTIKLLNGQDKLLGANIRNYYYNKRILIPNFVNLYINNTDGPITVDRNNADDDRFDISQMMLENNEKDFKSFYYDLEGFKKLDEVIKREDYLCESELPSQSSKRYNIVCPTHYTISIDEAFYGRYANDNTHCKINTKGEVVESKKLEISETCGSDSVNIVKSICEGRVDCNIKPNKVFFGEPCNMDIYKYLHIKYRCVKNKEFKKPEFAVVMFTDKINVNTIYENAISEFYQYCKIHNYTMFLNTQKYDTETSVFYMKLHVVKEAIIRGLKTHEFDWIFWIDSDIMLANPNIKLETFLPPLINDEIHLIISKDDNGLNAGIFFLRVHTWSLSFMMRSSVYTYYNKPRLLFYSDQASMNNVLVENESDKEHYILVPQKWFNMYLNKVEPGYFLIHFAGIVSKEERAKEVRIYLAGNPYYYATTSEDVRKEVEEYYKLPQNKTLQYSP